MLFPLVWKNWILFKRNWVGSLLVLILPILFILVAVIPIRNLFSATDFPDTLFMSTPAYRHNFTANTPLLTCLNESVGLSPAGGSLIADISEMVMEKGLQPHLFQSEEMMQEYVRSQEYGLANKSLCFGIHVHSDSQHKYNYSIRMNSTNKTPNTNTVASDLTVDSISFQKYAEGGFLQLQNWIDSLILSRETNQSYHLDNYATPVPQSAYTIDNLYSHIRSRIDILPIFALMIVFLRNVYNIVHEKETQIKYSMTIMGMSRFNYMASWLVAYIPIYIFLAIPSGLLLTVLTPKVSFAVYLMMYLLYGLLLSVQAIFISIFFSRPKIAISIASVYYVSQYLLVLLVRDKESLTASSTVWISMVPAASMALTFTGLIFASSNGVSVTLSNLNMVVLNIRMSGFFIATPIITLCYLFLIWYLDQVIPNKFGASKHPLFFLGIKWQKNLETELLENICQSVQQTAQAQIDHTHKIIVQNLHKLYEDKHVVKGISFQIKQNQIFSLLGHNGAGKTTTLSMLSGTLTPQQGQISYFGQNITEVQNMIGYCPQKNILFGQLTVEEHLRLFSAIKDINQENLKIEDLMADVYLSEKRDSLAKNLSGGQKRKLCLAISLVGGSKVIFMDEPTSGMDAYSRRFVWDMIRKYKQGRVMILTTHFMDEADYLGDRIGIMDHGQFRCIGSSLYLKNKFGNGYSLTIAKKNGKVDSEPIIQLIQEQISSPDCVPLSNVSQELIMQLPMAFRQSFPSLFEKLDAIKDELDIDSYGISITSLQDVFLRICDQNQQEEQNKGIEFSESQVSELDHFLEEDFISSKNKLRWAQFKASIIKKLRIIRKDWKAMVYQFILPIVIIALGMLMGTINLIKDMPSLEIKSSLYPNYHSFSDLPFDLPKSKDLTVDPATLLQFDLATNKSKRELMYSVFMNQNGSRFQIFSEAQTRLLHSPAIMVHESNLALIRNLSGNPVQINVYNYPLPRTRRLFEVNGMIAGMNVLFVISIALSFVLAGIMSAIVREKQCGSRAIQRQCGLSSLVYWLSNFILDFIKYMLVAIFAIIFIAIYDIESLITLNRIGAVGLLIVLYGLVVLPALYSISFLFKEYGSAENAVFILHVVFASLLPILFFVFETLNQDIEGILDGIAWPLSLIPFFGFGYGMLNLSTMKITILKNTGTNITVYDMDVLLPQIIMIIVAGILFWVALVFFENVHRECFFKGKPNEEHEEMDSDVNLERRVCIEAGEFYRIHAIDLQKQYESCSDTKLAVRGISFGVEQGNIFALLGTNGAGKTTTFKMLTGELLPSSGEVSILGKNLHENIEDMRNMVGYCPQHDPLIDLLSPKEHLQLIANIKGFKREARQKAIQNLLQLVNLKNWANVNTDELSGGNKRKLCLAMALMGSPPVVYLDEPSTGMDPASKRFMWRVIEEITQQDNPCTIVLTTHSMEEAEALSTKMAIMVEGTFKCIGSVQHIKTRYGDGYQLEVKFMILPQQPQLVIVEGLTDSYTKLDGPIDFVENFQAKQKLVIQYLNEQGFPEVDLLEKLNNYCRFKVKMESRQVGQLFEKVQMMSQVLQIEQYSLKQATVEQVFNKLAAHGEVQQ